MSSCAGAWCTMHTKQPGCLFVCSGVSSPWEEYAMSLFRNVHNSPRETLVSQHNPVQSLKVHLGRTLVIGAVSPGPSRFQLCAHFCSPQSLWLKWMQNLISFSNTKLHREFRCEAVKFAAWFKSEEAAGFRAGNPREVPKPWMKAHGEQDGFNNDTKTHWVEAVPQLCTN